LERVREIVTMRVEYGMKKEKGLLRVRLAMLFYVLKRLGLLGDAAKEMYGDSIS
jgi:hypothetical protein